MLLDDKRLKVDAFDPMLGAVLGNARGEEGGNVLAEAIIHGRAQVQLRDWLYCLVKTPATKARKYLVELTGKRPESFINAVEGGIDDDNEPKGTPASELTNLTVAPAVLKMLDTAENLASKLGQTKINDSIMTLALLEVADQDLKESLVLWMTAAGMKKFEEDLAPSRELSIFDSDGNLVIAAFDATGRAMCRRLTEDAASLGSKQITSRHLLYTLLGNESGLLATALAVRGVDVKNELHAALSRELVKPGKKRTQDFTLRYQSAESAVKSSSDDPGTMFPAVAQIFKAAGIGANRRGARGIGEFDISRAFVEQQPKELLRLFPPKDGFDLSALREYMASAEPEELEDTAVTRFTIKEIEEGMKERICGQSEAINRVLPWVKRLRFGLPRDGRPAAVFLFLGPTGTGKTQLAKELARYVFGDEEMMIFLEMGQFQSKESMSGFIGAPPGYVGYGEGKLTNGLRDKPECVVLFDEIEKAFTQVFDTLLRFADEGRISDPAGPVRDGRKCIIVMTTNAGQTWLRGHLESNPADRDNPEVLSQRLYEEAIKELQAKGFRPEFLGRVDERITFLPFNLTTCSKIVNSVLERELYKFNSLKGITISVPDEVREFLAQTAFKRSMEEGARGAPRAVNDFIVTPAIDQVTSHEADGIISEPMLLHASMKGLDRVVIDSDTTRAPSANPTNP